LDDPGDLADDRLSGLPLLVLGLLGRLVGVAGRYQVGVAQAPVYLRGLDLQSLGRGQAQGHGIRHGVLHVGLEPGIECRVLVWDIIVRHFSVLPLLKNLTYNDLCDKNTLFPIPARDFPLAIRGFPLAIRDLPIPARAAPLAVRDLPIPDRDLPITTRAAPLAIRDLPIPARAAPLAIRDLPIPARAAPLADREAPIPDAKGGPSTPALQSGYFPFSSFFCFSSQHAFTDYRHPRITASGSARRCLIVSLRFGSFVSFNARSHNSLASL